MDDRSDQGGGADGDVPADAVADPLEQRLAAIRSELAAVDAEVAEAEVPFRDEAWLASVSAEDAAGLEVRVTAIAQLERRIMIRIAERDEAQVEVAKQQLYDAVQAGVQHAATWVRDVYPVHAAAIAAGLGVIEQMVPALDEANAKRPAGAPLILLMVPDCVLPGLAPGADDFWPPQAAG